MVQINYEVRLKSNAKYEMTEIEESLRNIFELFDDGVKSLIPKQDKEKIMNAINGIMDETETKDLLEALNVVEDCVSEVMICEESEKYSDIPNTALGKFYLYTMDKAEGEEEHIDEEEGNILSPYFKTNLSSKDGEIAACQTWMLPNKAFYGLWESLHYSSSLKTDLIQYAETSFRLSQLGVSNTLISWNKVILFHGPPGTGKTSIAQVDNFKCSKTIIFLGICSKISDSTNRRISKHGTCGDQLAFSLLEVVFRVRQTRPEDVCKNKRLRW